MCSTRQRLAALIREERVARGLSLRTAADKAGLAPSTLSRWEAGACVPRVPELELLLRSFGVREEDVTRILVSLDAPRAAKAARHGTSDRVSQMVAPSGGALFRALRSRSRMSITSVADALGVSPSTVSRWESSASHPAPELAEKLLDLLHAGSETRQCLSNSGVAKIRAERPPYDRERLQARLEALERAPHEEEERSELRFLQLQSVLWWFRDQSGAMDLLRRSFVAYAEFLCAHARYRETIEQAQIVVESGLDPTCDTAVRAWRVIARADVYRWPQPRPHGGLFTLQRCLAASSTPTPALVGLLNDMAEYSLLADRPTEAEHYMNRAREAAGDLTARARLQFVAPRQPLQPVVACPA